jgi:hypothetical protein
VIGELFLGLILLQPVIKVVATKFLMLEEYIDPSLDAGLTRFLAHVFGTIFFCALCFVSWGIGHLLLSK